MGGNKKKNKKDKVVVAEYRVSMHCNACEKSVAEAISNMKGVEKFMTDMKNHRVEITGRIDPEKVSKKLRKKTGKRVELLVEDKNEEEEEKECEEQVLMDSPWLAHYYGDGEMHMMFNDENPNSCFIM